MDAISLSREKDGFSYPRVDNDLCINCGKCVNVCAYKNDKNEVARAGQRYEPVAAYAAARTSEDIMRSSSGGVFAALANSILSNSGAVYGCSWEEDDSVLKASFRRVNTVEDVRSTLGSKYVQSDFRAVYSPLKRDLDLGIPVLVCGTPCQIAALKAYLGHGYDNLIALDLICHGVASPGLFKEDLQKIVGAERKLVSLTFRSKESCCSANHVSYGLRGQIQMPDGCIEDLEFVDPADSVYYYLFLSWISLRDCCYRCPYAGGERPGDITIGDFWGIEVTRPDLIKGSGGILELNKGVSCVLCNTAKGESALREYKGDLLLERVRYEDAKRFNSNLTSPSKERVSHRLFVLVYDRCGFRGVSRLKKILLLRDRCINYTKSIIKKLLLR